MSIHPCVLWLVSVIYMPHVYYGLYQLFTIYSGRTHGCPNQVGSRCSPIVLLPWKTQSCCLPIQALVMASVVNHRQMQTQTHSPSTVFPHIPLVKSGKTTVLSDVNSHWVSTLSFLLTFLAVASPNFLKLSYTNNTFLSPCNFCIHLNYFCHWKWRLKVPPICWNM